MEQLNARIQLKNDLANNWTKNNPALKKGEIGIENDTGKFKIGDGTTNWTNLKYSNFTESEIQGIVEQNASAVDALDVGTSEDYDVTSDKEVPTTKAVKTIAKKEVYGNSIQPKSITVFDASKEEKVNLITPTGIVLQDTSNNKQFSIRNNIITFLEDDNLNRIDIVRDGNNLSINDDMYASSGYKNNTVTIDKLKRISTHENSACNYGTAGQVLASGGENGNLYWTNMATGDVPTKVSQLTNDSGYITSSALSGYLTSSGGNISGSLSFINSQSTALYKLSNNGFECLNDTTNKLEQFIHKGPGTININGGDVGNLQIYKLKYLTAPNSSGSTTFSGGSSGQALMSDGIACYWGTPTDTKDTTGSSNKTSTKLYLTGATSQTTSSTTYSNSAVYVDPFNRLCGTSGIYTNKFYAPTSSGGTSYGVGSNGKVLMSNGSTNYWGNINLSSYATKGCEE